MTEGTLIIKNKKNKKEIMLRFTNSKNEYKQQPINERMMEQISLALSQKITEGNPSQEITVEFEENGNQISKIREKGTEWDREEKKGAIRQDKPVQASPTAKAVRDTKFKGDFHNPYNFIPAPPRTQDFPLGDGLPKGHGCYHPDHWSGRIAVTLETVTPLLIPDAANLTEDDKQHKTYPIRVDAAGNPYLPPTSLKGMLRSAYEAVTNSRFGIFESHEDRLAYRTPAKITVVPARVEKQQERLYLRILEESDLVGGAAKLKRYDKKSFRRDKGEKSVATKYDDTQKIPQHGDRVWVKLNAEGTVTNIRQSQPRSERDWKEGWVCATGANISSKIYERVFINNQDNDLIPVTEQHKALWEQLINNYQNIHEKDLEKRNNENRSPRDYLGDEPGKTAWSRHIRDENEKEFKEGTLCYVEFQDDEEIIAIQPVTISRRLYQTAPKDLLDQTLEPASSIEELSPADRVFGWVKQKNKNDNGKKETAQKGATSYKGNLRIFNVTCDSDDPIESFGEQGFPLAILGKPNEQQARFYLAQDKQGTPLQNEIAKEQMYASTEQGLRGRKVYPHHNGLPPEHWQNPETYRKEPINRHSQEYRQPSGEKEKTDQNRSIKAWVKPNVKFSFTIDIINLSPVELGALLWLLSLEDNHYHRLGGGKPLGFGSVKLSINWDKTELGNGQAWKEYYSSLISSQSPDSQAAQSCIQTFKESIKIAYGQEFEQVPFIQAFGVAAQGFQDQLPIHYPRITPEINPNGEGFEWFVDNERVGGLKLSLPSLVDDTGLLIKPTQ